MSPDRGGDVVVTGLGREVRRCVGPNAWTVLEELVARASQVDGGSPAVEVAMGQLDQCLGLSAEVIRSALRRLVAAGVVEREQLRSPETNRFAGTRYRIVGTTGLLPAPGAAAPTAGEPDGGEPAAHELSVGRPWAAEPTASEPATGYPDPGGVQPCGRRTTQACARTEQAQLELLDLSTSTDANPAELRTKQSHLPQHPPS